MNGSHTAVALGGTGLATAAVTAILWICGLFHVSMTEDVALAFVTLLSVPVHLALSGIGANAVLGGAASQAQMVVTTPASQGDATTVQVGSGGGAAPTASVAIPPSSSVVVAPGPTPTVSGPAQPAVTPPGGAGPVPVH